MAQVVSELDLTRGTKQEISKGFYEIDSKRNKLLQEKNAYNRNLYNDICKLMDINI